MLTDEEPDRWELVGGDSKNIRHLRGHYQLVLECLSAGAEGWASVRLREIVDALNDAIELRKALTIANDAMCQASFIVGKRKSDLNHAIDVARKALGQK